MQSKSSFKLIFSQKHIGLGGKEMVGYVLIRNLGTAVSSKSCQLIYGVFIQNSELLFHVRIPESGITPFLLKTDTCFQVLGIESCVSHSPAITVNVIGMGFQGPVHGPYKTIFSGSFHSDL